MASHLAWRTFCGLGLCGVLALLAGCRGGDPPLESPLAQKELTLDMGRGVKMEFVAIPPGRFIMGGKPGNLPRSKVSICKPFYMAKYEVTQEQWMAVMDRNPSGAQYKNMKFPVQRVSWSDCKSFVHRMNQKFGTSSGMTFALPTEAKWEYACQAGTGDTDSPAIIEQYAWMGKNSDRDPHPVGEKKPNAWGLYDMQGNVAEFCADWINEKGESKYDAEWHVVRGGDWHGGYNDCNSRSRFERRADVPLRLDGLRLICMPE
jgi:formylglycine-generating enzyme required for sulfatase activity